MESQDKRLLTQQGVKVVRIGYSSYDGATQIKALLWAPEAKMTNPRGIIQITHGMEEHIGRYVDFANYLASEGFIVCGQDLIGHGKSVTEPEKLSCLPLEGGREVLIEDAHELRKMVASRFSRQTPYIMFGHSLGSYIMRDYIARYGEGLSGVILSGAGEMSRLLSRFGKMLASFIARTKGEDHRSGFLEEVGMGAYAKSITDPRTEYDWLCSDEEVVDEYIADPLCGVPFSAGAYATVSAITGEVASLALAKKTPKELPVLLVAGSCDPVGGNGKGVEKVADLLRRGGVEQVEVKLYEGLRHEILNEPSKKEVYTDIVKWIEGVIEKR